MKERSIFRYALILGSVLFAQIAAGQTQPAAPATSATPRATYGDYDWLYRVGVVCGGGASESSAATKPSGQCGGILGLGFFDLEAGAMSPTANHNAVTGYLSTNLWIPLVPWRDLGNKHGIPVAVGGYTQMFGTSNALNYGVAYAYPVNESHSVQFEVRDYWTIASPSQHNVVFHVAWLLCMPDP
jgi:hypothetical protein